MEDIRSKTEELNNAFSGAHDIQNKLLKSNIITEDILLNRQRANVLSFFQEVRGNLKIISKRIDSVKPRLNEYIRNINRHDFYIRFKRFFNQLLEKALWKKAKSVSLMAYQVSRYVILSNQGLLSLKKILMELPLVGSKQRNQKFRNQRH